MNGVDFLQEKLLRQNNNFNSKNNDNNNVKIERRCQWFFNLWKITYFYDLLKDENIYSIYVYRIKKNLHEFIYHLYNKLKKKKKSNINIGIMKK